MCFVRDLTGHTDVIKYRHAAIVIVITKMFLTLIKTYAIERGGVRITRTCRAFALLFVHLIKSYTTKLPFKR